MVGFNQFDKSTATLGKFIANTSETIGDDLNCFVSDYIRIIPGQSYYINHVIGTAVHTYAYVLYDANKNAVDGGSAGSGTDKSILFTAGSNIHYIRFNGLKGKIDNTCINLHWDGERDGEYEPYVKHSYPLGNVELRGVPKLDANNSLYYDGDEYASDGTVTRRYGIVDLGTLTWILQDGATNLFYSAITGLKQASTNDERKTIFLCSKYTADTQANVTESVMTDKTALTRIGRLYIKDTSYTDAATFKTAMSGVYLVYELATPTTESSDPFQNPQIVDDFGTEEYIDRGVLNQVHDVAIPVGHETTYQANLRAKLEMAPDSPGDGNGDYVVRQTNGINEYVKLNPSNVYPERPQDDGTYILQAVFDGTTVTYQWVQVSSLSGVSF